MAWKETHGKIRLQKMREEVNVSNGLMLTFHAHLIMILIADMVHDGIIGGGYVLSSLVG